MPLFEYTCGKCGHRFEELVSVSDAKAPKCPKCNSEKTERQLSVFSAPGGGGNACESGSCDTGSCPTGTCPFG